LSNQKCPESVFNFDTSFVNDKKSLTYKEISHPDYADGMSANIIVNRLYEQQSILDKLCTNACKCDVKLYDKPDARVKVAECNCANFVANRGYGNEEMLIEQQKTQLNLIKSEELLDFARQIAVGMDFLAQNKVVHRDLAARNVLVCPNKVVKIADFGLSRDIYQENMYRKTTKGKLPIKWLALESMTHQVYTSQSDVWAFGILLYEIVTLGSNPYPSVPVNRLLSLLKNGYRMERPLNCDEEIYKVMYSCWLTHPGDRPSFEDLIVQIQELINKETDERKMIILDQITDELG
jgi:tyrosine-protein kinase receptor torso